MRDQGRADNYAAEDAAFEGTALERQPGGPALEAALTTVLDATWWRVNVGDPAVVRRVQVRTASDSHWAPRTGTLAIDPREPWYVVTHELAHVAAGGGTALAGQPVHGAGWRGWNIALVGAVYGEAFGSLLAATFGRYELPADVPAVQPPSGPLVAIRPTSPERAGWRPPR